MDLNRIFKNVIEKEGIYYTEKKSSVSYPDYGNDECLQLEDSSFWFKHRNNIIIETVKKFCNKGDSFLDVGGGNGFVSKALQDIEMDVVLVEPGEKGVENAKQRGVSNVVCAALQDLDVEKKDIKAIGLFDVIEHIEDDEKFLKINYGYLSNGGYIFITVPAYNFLWSSEDAQAEHFRRYTLGSLKRKMKKCGFENIYSTYMFGFLLMPIFMMRTLPFRLGMRKNKKSLEGFKKEHTVSKNSEKSLLNMFMKNELNKVKRGKKIALGGSCLIVARKP